ncbi:MAG: DinB family protein [Bacteroidetes bacterium]|nr:DinB family protein [Bacteroidota bacterium]
MRTFRLLTQGVLCVVSLSLTIAQEKQKADSPPAGFRGEFLWQLDDVEKKLLSLAEAIPAEQYSWRPGEGVRSTSEVFMHVAGTNYMLPSTFGVEVPEGINRGMEKTVTDKAEVLKYLKASLGHIRLAALNTDDSDLDNPVKLFNRVSTVRGVFLISTAHTWEHLGQAIAYARINGIVPPWTAERQARQKQK